jgi:hypothetical protein
MTMNVHHGIMRNWRVQHDEGEEQAVKKAGKPPQRGVEIATHYLDLHSCADTAWRIDVVAVQFSVHGKLEDIRVYQHAVTR